jgi:light-regulated signal transduction histidine kinase (bacteriophytochrome)
MTADEDHAVDLTNCDREPIHIPGLIQPHGVLMALSPSLTVTQTSDNVVARLGLSVDDVLCRSLADVLGTRAADIVAAALVDGRWKEANPLGVVARGQHLDAIVHEHDGVTIVELEPAPKVPGADARSLRSLLSALQHARTLDELCRCAVREVKRLTRFERVMLYRFDAAGHGSVDAEARDPGLDPYLGLRYPASDIPQQARALYRKNWLRLIPDARYTPARLVPSLRPDTGAPLDLTFAVLRSVSPIHLEYLENMGIRASFSVSLIVDDELWGLISCGNHSGPLMVPYEVRSAVEVIGRLLSLQFAALAQREAAPSNRTSPSVCAPADAKPMCWLRPCLLRATSFWPSQTPAASPPSSVTRSLLMGVSRRWRACARSLRGSSASPVRRRSPPIGWRNTRARRRTPGRSPAACSRLRCPARRCGAFCGFDPRWYAA